MTKKLPGIRAAIVWLIVLAATQPTFAQEAVDLRLADLASDAVMLNKGWVWFDRQLIPPDQVQHDRGIAVSVPGLWNTLRSSKSGQGYATYSLKLLVPTTQKLAIDMPTLYCAYQLWVNGKLIASNGKVSAQPENYQPQWRPQIAAFEPSADTVHVVLQVANFSHFKGGTKDPFYLGAASLLEKKSTLAFITTAIESSVLFVLALVFSLIFATKDRKKVVIYFSLLCATWSVRAAFSNNYLVSQLLPDFNWHTLVRIEYLTIFLTVIWAILFLGRLFATEVNAFIKYFLVTVNSLFVGFAIITPPLVFTEWLNVYLVVAGLVIVYGGFVVIRAVVNERTGSGLFVLSTSMGMLAFTYDIFTYEGVFEYNGFILTIAYMTVFVLMAIALLYFLNILKSRKQASSILTYKDLYGDSHK